MKKLFIPVLLPVFTALLAFYGVKLGHESATENSRELWAVERQAIINEKTVDKRMSLFERASSILYKTELMNAISNKLEINHKISQLKASSIDDAENNTTKLKDALDEKNQA